MARRDLAVLIKHKCGEGWLAEFHFDLNALADDRFPGWGFDRLRPGRAFGGRLFHRFHLLRLGRGAFFFRWGLRRGRRRSHLGRHHALRLTVCSMAQPQVLLAGFPTAFFALNPALYAYGCFANRTVMNLARAE